MNHQRRNENKNNEDEHEHENNNENFIKEKQNKNYSILRCVQYQYPENLLGTNEQNGTTNKMKNDNEMKR